MDHGQGDEHRPGALEAALGTEPLENLGDDDREDREVLFLAEG